MPKYNEWLAMVLDATPTAIPPSIPATHPAIDVFTTDALGLDVKGHNIFVYTKDAAGKMHVINLWYDGSDYTRNLIDRMDFNVAAPAQLRTEHVIPPRPPCC